MTPIPTRALGALQVSIVGLGTNNFGMRIDEEKSHRVIDAALEVGINFFDTADLYGPSEEFIGRALEGRRDQVILATKFGKPVEGKGSGARPEYVMRALEVSLDRLRTNWVDLYQIHEPDLSVPIGETLAALDDLVKAGKVKEIGCSNFSVPQLQEAEAAVAKGGARFVSVQNEYSLMKREAEADVLPECERAGLAFLPYFPLASGLTGDRGTIGDPVGERQAATGADGGSDQEEHGSAGGRAVGRLGILFGREREGTESTSHQWLRRYRPSETWRVFGHR